MKKNQNLSVIKPLVNIRRQGGWTFWSLAFTLGVLAFASYVGMQLVPIYIVNGNIENAMIRSVDGVNVKTVGRSEIIKKIDQQLYLDGSHKILDYKKDLVIKRSRSLFTLQISYERRVPIAGNISILVQFSPFLECGFSSKCTLK
jgi:hypothetical protein